MDRVWKPIAEAMANGTLGDRLVDIGGHKKTAYYQIRFAVKQNDGESIVFSFHCPVGTPKKRAIKCRDIALNAAQKGLLEGHVAMNRFIGELRKMVKEKNDEDKRKEKERCQK